MRIFQKTDSRSIVDGLDPRVRLAVALTLSFLVVVLEKWESLALAALAAVFLLAIAKGFRWRIFRRHAELNMLAAFLIILVPLSTPGEAVFSWGPLQWTAEGFDAAFRIAAKANIVMAICGSLLATLDPMVLARAAAALGVPEKLSHILFFCVRYLESAHIEYHRLRNAMKARGFRAGFNGHSLRSLGYLVGMMFIRGVDRSDRVLEAMKCRGFDGRLYSLSAFSARLRDAVFAGVVVAAGFALAFVEWGAAWRNI